jgi:hypothetical protein
MLITKNHSRHTEAQLTSTQNFCGNLKCAVITICTEPQGVQIVPKKLLCASQFGGLSEFLLFHRFLNGFLNKRYALEQSLHRSACCRGKQGVKDLAGACTANFSNPFANLVCSTCAWSGKLGENFPDAYFIVSSPDCCPHSIHELLWG